MRVILCDNYDELSNEAAKIVSSQMIIKPDCTLGLATGSTPIGLYQRLIEMNKNGEIDFSEVTSFNLDEYYPISRSNSQSYYYFMNEQLFSKVNIDLAKTHIPNGEAKDPEQECKDYDKLLKDHGGVDLQILGIGQNGHIGFNEPDGNLIAPTHLTGLTQSTLDANSRFFTEDEVMPTKALTMGMATILSAKKIIILASGASKSRAVAELLDDSITTSNPATLLKLHPDVVLICDKDAFGGMKLGVDIGGTNIKFAVVDGTEVKYKSSIPTDTSSSENLIKGIADECKKIMADYPVKTVGVGLPGLINNGEVYAGNLPFKNTPVAKLLKQHINLPITIENDGNCAALGEVIMGEGKDYNDAVLVAIGTGIGGGIIVNKQIYHGKGNAGEIGHITVKADNGIPCPCGLSGCLEQYCSATALIRQATEAALANTDSILYDVYTKNGNKLMGEQVFEAMDKGCPVAAKVYDEYIGWLAVGISSIVNVLDPEVVILAGGITEQGDKLLNPLKEKMGDKKIDIRISKLQSGAGSLGAAML